GRQGTHPGIRSECQFRPALRPLPPQRRQRPPKEGPQRLVPAVRTRHSTRPPLSPRFAEPRRNRFVIPTYGLFELCKYQRPLSLRRRTTRSLTSLRRTTAVASRVSNSPSARKRPSRLTAGGASFTVVSLTNSSKPPAYASTRPSTHSGSASWARR